MEIPTLSSAEVLEHLQNGHRFYETSKPGRFLLPANLRDPSHYQITKGISDWLRTEHSIQHLNEQTRAGGIHSPLLDPGIETLEIIHGYIYGAGDISKIAEILGVDPQQITHGLDAVAEL